MNYKIKNNKLQIVVKLQKFDKHLVAEQSSVSAKPCFETAKNKRDPLLHLNHFLHHMASIQVFLVIKKWWKPSPKRHKCSPPGILECNFNNRVSTMCMFPAYSVCWQKQWTCLKKRKTCWLSISSSTSLGSPPRAQTRYSMASSMTTLRRCGASIIWCQQKKLSTSIEAFCIQNSQEISTHFQWLRNSFRGVQEVLPKRYTTNQDTEMMEMSEMGLLWLIIYFEINFGDLISPRIVFGDRRSNANLARNKI